MQVAGLVRPGLGLGLLVALVLMVPAGLEPRHDRTTAPAPSSSRAIHVRLAPAASDTGPAIVAAATGMSAATAEQLVVPLFSRVAAAATGSSTGELGVLWRWWRIELPASEHEAQQLVRALRAHPSVDTAFIAPHVELPVVAGHAIPTTEASCPVTTPSYEPYQGYLAEAPAGINAPAAWAHPGGRGQGVWFADVEGAWNADHEDLPGERMVHAGGAPIADRGYEAHGTAVVGVVAARDNGLGMVGLVPEVERIVTASIGNLSVADAIDVAQSELRPGDVLLIELHAIGPRRRFIPVEYWQDVFDAIRVATDRGVIVVEAAGNGGENLDHRAYGRRFDRSHRDSGAILVGAGAPAKAGFTDRSRLDFSNYGTRVDVQGWGRMVATLDYGDLQRCAGTGRHYTVQFAGTSSASPIVASAAIALQGIHKHRTGSVLSPSRVRALLVSTGTAQTDGPHGPRRQHIGPRPDLERAIRALPGN